MRRERLDIHPRNNTTILWIFLRGEDFRKEPETDTAQPCGFTGVYFRNVEFCIPFNEPDIIDHLHFGIFCVEHFLVKDVIPQQDRIIRG